MKTDAIIIQHNDSKYFFGYISGFPAICAQADSVDGVVKSLKTCAKLYFDFMAKNEIEIGNPELISLQMNFAELKEYLSEEYGCEIIHLGEHFYLVTNCIHGTRCVIQDLEFYDTSTLCHYFIELNVDAPQEFEDFYHVYMTFREREDVKETKN